MPFKNTYTKTVTYEIVGGENPFKRTISYPYTATGNERKIINENIPAYTTGSGILFSFNTGSGAYLGFRSDNNLPLAVSGAGWNYRIVLSSGTHPQVSFFARTGLGAGYESSDGLSVADINGVVYVTNPNATTAGLTIESTSDATAGWGTQNP